LTNRSTQRNVKFSEAGGASTISPTVADGSQSNRSHLSKKTDSSPIKVEKNLPIITEGDLTE